MCKSEHVFVVTLSRYACLSELAFSGREMFRKEQKEEQKEEQYCSEGVRLQIDTV